jgi:NADH dehydrogenase/NADH:ubiquinone oxidoreductase subunit G
MATLPELIQISPDTRRRQELARAMMQSGMSSAPVQHWTQGANRLAQSLIGAYNLRTANKEEEQQRKDAQAALQQALSQQGQQGGIAGLASALSQNPNTRSFATQLQLQNMMNQMGSQQKSAQSQAQLERDKQLAEYKAQLKQQYPPPESEFDKYLKTIQAEKGKAELAKKQQEIQQQQQAAKEQGYNTQAAAKRLEELVQHPGFENIYGSFEGVMPTVKQESVNAEAIRQNVTDILTLAARGQLKGQGQITEGETRMLRDAQSILSNPRIDEKTAMQEAGRVLTYLKSKGANVDDQLINQLTGQQQLQGRRSGRSDLRQPAAPEGWNLMEDANGNRAYVGPNGEIREL